jgi:DmsE family decaheme c-type cytochrome
MKTPGNMRRTSPWRCSLGAVQSVAMVVLLAAAVVAVGGVGVADEGAPAAAGAPAAKPKASAPAAPKYAGSDLCVACHGDVPKAQEHQWHAQRIAAKPGSTNCEECHGPSAAHTEDPGEVHTYYDVTHARADKSAAACLRCHEDKIKPALWKTSEHAQANVKCWDCHSQGATPHSKLIRKPGPEVCYSCHPEQRATFELTSHHPVREGRVTCSDCHDPHKHTTTRDKIQSCLNCHPDRRGPFIFEHPVVRSANQLTGGCLACHRPHGSPNEFLHKFAGRGLCLQCHADHALHFVGRTCWDSGCHADQHGSNTNPLFLGD